MQLSTTCSISHSPGNAHVLPLPNALGTTYTCFKVTATSQSPATRSSLHHLPMGHCHCQGPRNQALATRHAYCLHLPGSIHSTQKYIVSPHKIPRVLWYIHSPPRLQSFVSLNSQNKKKKYKQNEEAQEAFQVKKTEEFP